MTAATAVNLDTYRLNEATRDMLREAYGDPFGAKRLARHAGASVRTARNWLDGLNTPQALHLIAIMAQSEAITAEVLRLAGRSQGIEIERRDAALAKIQSALGELNGGHARA